MIVLRCPMCDHPVGRAYSESGVAYAEYRCRNRACGQPVITFRLSEGRATACGIIDRGERKRVS